MCPRATPPQSLSLSEKTLSQWEATVIRGLEAVSLRLFLGGLVSALRNPRLDEDSSPTPGQADLVEIQPQDDSEFYLQDQIDELSVHSFLIVLAQSVSHSTSAFGQLFSNLHLARRDIVLAVSSLDVSTRTSLRGLPISKHALFGLLFHRPPKIAPNDRGIPWLSRCQVPNAPANSLERERSLLLPGQPEGLSRGGRSGPPQKFKRVEPLKPPTKRRPPSNRGRGGRSGKTGHPH